MEFKNPYLLDQKYYGEWLYLPASITNKPTLDDPIVKMFAEAIKKRILASFLIPPSKIEDEQIILRAPREDKEYDRKFDGTVGWKAILTWDEEK